MMVRVHVDAETVKLHAFGLEAHALFETVLAGEKNLAFSADDAMPRNSRRVTIQRPNDLPSGARMSGGVGDVSVSGNLAARHASDGGKHVGKHGAGHEEKIQTQFAIRNLQVPYPSARFVRERVG